MCKYCEKHAFNVLIESEEIGNLIYFITNRTEKISYDDIKDCMVDSCVVLDIRDDCGYIRLGDPHEMGCIDHSSNFKIEYCPKCGRNLSE